MRSIFLVFIITVVAAVSCVAQKHPVKPAGPAMSDGQFDITIEGGGHKTEVKSTQFKNVGGFFLDNENGMMSIDFKADDDADKKIWISGRLPKAAAGTYELRPGEGTAIFNVTTSEFPNVELFMGKSGSIEILNMPAAFGLIAGNFTEICEVPNDDGTISHYTVSGSFKIPRGPAIR